CAAAAASRRFPPRAAAASRRRFPPHAAAASRCARCCYIRHPGNSPFAASRRLRHCFPPSRLPAAASRLPPPAPSCTIRAPGNLLPVPPRFTHTPSAPPPASAPVHPVHPRPRPPLLSSASKQLNNLYLIHPIDDSISFIHFIPPPLAFPYNFDPHYKRWTWK
ncbi:hypothetical protein B0H17DRAFT_1328464, partial [Mycena rosella]